MTAKNGSSDRIFGLLMFGFLLSTLSVGSLIYFFNYCQIHSALKIAADYNIKNMSYSQARFLLSSKLNYTDNQCENFLLDNKKRKKFSNEISKPSNTNTFS